MSSKYNKYGGKNISNSTNYKKVTGTLKPDVIYNSGYGANINASSGNDFIGNEGSNLLIKGGAGNDTIASKAYNVTIEGGNGNDTLVTSTSYGDVFSFDNYDGHDVITNYGTKDTIYLKDVTSSRGFTSYKSGSSRIIKAGSTYITLKGAASKNINVRYKGGSTTIYANSKNDTSKSDDYSNVKTNTKSNAMFYGTSSNDVILNKGSYVTIRGGAGNDTITNKGRRVVYQYNPSTDGNDVIYGFSLFDTLSIPTSIKSYSESNSGNDKILTIGSGKVTLKSAAAYSSLNIYSSYNTSKNFVERWFNEDDNLAVSNADQLDSIIDNKINLISNDEKFDIDTEFTKNNEVVSPTYNQDKKDKGQTTF